MTDKEADEQIPWHFFNTKTLRDGEELAKVGDLTDLQARAISRRGVGDHVKEEVDWGGDEEDKDEHANDTPEEVPEEADTNRGKWADIEDGISVQCKHCHANVAIGESFCGACGK